VWGSGCIAPPFLASALAGGEWSVSRLRRFKDPPVPIGWEAGGVRAGLVAMEKRKISCLCRESNSCRPARSLCTVTRDRMSQGSTDSCGNGVGIYWAPPENYSKGSARWNLDIQMHPYSCEGSRPLGWKVFHNMHQGSRFFYYYSYLGETEYTSYRGHYWSTVSAPDDKWWWLWSNC
jgi:hypothetical protein